jgi:hypothetical protein
MAIETVNSLVQLVTDLNKQTIPLKAGINANLKPNLQSLGTVGGDVNQIPIFTAPGVFSTIDKNNLIQGLNYDSYVPTISDRSAYDNEAKDYKVLVGDNGSGRAVLFIKKSNLSADWSSAIFITGDRGLRGFQGDKGDKGDPGVGTQGPKGDTGPAGADGATINVVAGTTTTTSPGTNAQVTSTLVSPTQLRLDFQIPRGQDGSGTGNVVGPSTGTYTGQFAIFSDSTGKRIEGLSNISADIVTFSVAGIDVPTTADDVQSVIEYLVSRRPPSSQVPFSNTTSSLPNNPSNVQAAIDSLAGRTIYGSGIVFNNTTSSLPNNPSNVQAAIDSLASRPINSNQVLFDNTGINIPGSPTETHAAISNFYSDYLVKNSERWTKTELPAQALGKSILNSNDQTAIRGLISANRYLDDITQSEAEAGTSTIQRNWSSLNVRQSINYLLSNVWGTPSLYWTKAELPASTIGKNLLNVVDQATGRSLLNAQVLLDDVTQAEAVAGTSTTNKNWSSLRVRQAINAVTSLIPSDAASVTFDNSIAGYPSAPTNVQKALEVVKSIIPTTATGINFDNSVTNFQDNPVNVQKAIESATNLINLQSEATGVGFDNSTIQLTGTPDTVYKAFASVKSMINTVSSSSNISFSNTASSIPGSPSNVQSAIDSFHTEFNSAVAAKLNLTGGTLTGDLNIQKNTPSLYLNETGLNAKWRIQHGGGGNLRFDQFDSSNNQVTPLTISPTGEITSPLIGALSTALGSKVNDTGDTMTGDLAINKNFPAVSFQYPTFPTWNIGPREDGRFYYYLPNTLVAPLSFGQDGSIASNQFGDLLTALNSKVNDTGDTMTGDLTISKTYPQMKLTYTGVASWGIYTNIDGKMYHQYTPSGGSPSNPIVFGSNGSISTAQIGDLKTALDNINTNTIVMAIALG